MTICGIVNPVAGEDDKDDIEDEYDGGEEGGDEGEDHGDGTEYTRNNVPTAYCECEDHCEEGDCTGDGVNYECGCEGLGDNVGGVGVDVEKLEEGWLEIITEFGGGALSSFGIGDAFHAEGEGGELEARHEAKRGDTFR